MLHCLYVEFKTCADLVDATIIEILMLQFFINFLTFPFSGRISWLLWKEMDRWYFLLLSTLLMSLFFPLTVLVLWGLEMMQGVKHDNQSIILKQVPVSRTTVWQWQWGCHVEQRDVTWHLSVFWHKFCLIILLLGELFPHSWQRYLKDWWNLPHS